MESEKVKEIKKALECCSVRNGNCNECPFIKEGFDCDLYLLKDALKLINELESENESLKKSYIVKAYDKLKAENKNLKETFNKFTGEVKENLKESVNAENVDYYVECVKVINKILKRYSNE